MAACAGAPAAVVDAHVHFWTADEARYPLAPGFTADDLWLPSFTPADYSEFAPDGRTRINLVQMTWYGLDHCELRTATTSHTRTTPHTHTAPLPPPPSPSPPPPPIALRHTTPSSVTQPSGRLHAGPAEH